MTVRKARIETGTVLSIASLTMTIILAVIQFMGAANAESDMLRQRICAVEAAVGKGECGK